MAVMAVLLVVAAVAAVVAGYHLGRVVMQVLFSPSEAVDAPPQADPQPPVTAPTVAKAEVQLPAIQLQRVQVGAFGKAEGAAEKARALQAEGVPAFVMGPLADDFYRVVCGLYTDKNAANRVAQAIKREVYVNELRIPAQEITLESTDRNALEVLQDAYAFIPSAIAEQAKIWDSYQLGRESGLVTAATQLAEDVKGQHDDLASLTPPASLTGQHQTVVSILEALLRSSLELQAMTEKKGQEHYMNAATFFIEAVEKYLVHISQ